MLSKPLEVVPPRVRDDIGWLSLVTMFLALAVMVALALFRCPENLSRACWMGTV